MPHYQLDTTGGVRVSQLYSKHGVKVQLIQHLQKRTGPRWQGSAKKEQNQPGQQVPEMPDLIQQVALKRAGQLVAGRTASRGGQLVVSHSATGPNRGQRTDVTRLVKSAQPQG